MTDPGTGKQSGRRAEAKQNAAGQAAAKRSGGRPSAKPTADRGGRATPDDAGKGGKPAAYDWSPDKPAARRWSVNKPIAGKRSPSKSTAGNPAAGKSAAGKGFGDRPAASPRSADKPGTADMRSAEVRPADERRMTAGERNEQRRQERRAARKSEARGGAGNGPSGGDKPVGGASGPSGRRGAAGQLPGSAGVPVERAVGPKRSGAGPSARAAGPVEGAVGPRSSGAGPSARAAGPVKRPSGTPRLSGDGTGTGGGGTGGGGTGRGPRATPDARTTRSSGRAHRHKAAALDKPADDVYRAGFACFVGRPNAGKSTLTNAIIGQKIAITSSKPQTTRHIIRGILHRANSQLVLVDTPGLHRPRTLLGERLNDLVKEVWSEVDVIGICFPADEKVGRGDRFIAAEMAELKATVIAVVTKVDLVDPARLAQHLLDVSELYEFADIVPVSAVSGHQVETLVDVIVKHLPESPQLYPAETITDEPEQVLIAELIREAALEGVRDELPHSIAVLVEEMMVEGNLTKIFANLYIERPSQKSIVIGTGGARLKDVGTRARVEIEALLGKKVYLDLHVRVAKEWQRDPKQLRKLGF